MTVHHLRNTRGRKRVENCDTQSKLGLCKCDQNLLTIYPCYPPAPIPIGATCVQT